MSRQLNNAEETVRTISSHEEAEVSIREQSNRAAEDNNWRDQSSIHSTLAESIKKKPNKAKPEKEEIAEFEECDWKPNRITITRTTASESQTEAEQIADTEFKQIAYLQTWTYLRSARDVTSCSRREDTPFSMFLMPIHNVSRSFTVVETRLSVGEDIINLQRHKSVEMISPTLYLESLEEQTSNLLGTYPYKIIKSDSNSKMIVGDSTTRLLIKNDPEAIKYQYEDKCILVKILSTLFGLLEAAELWYRYLNNTLKDGGYMQCPLDLCLWRWSEDDGNHLIIGIYMDNYIHVYKGENVEIESYLVSTEVNLYDLERKKSAEQSAEQPSVWFLEQDITKKAVEVIDEDHQLHKESQWNSVGTTPWIRRDKTSSNMTTRPSVQLSALKIQHL